MFRYIFYIVSLYLHGTFKRLCMKKVYVKYATLKIPNGFIGIIGKWYSGALTISQLPIPVIIVDPDSKEEFSGELISVLPFNGNIPEIIALQVMNKFPSECQQDLLQLHGVSDINHLAYYLYGNFGDHPHPTLLEKVLG